ncbi:MAG TPA: 2-hydroxychromene-2-carboxylate isomerase [Myxococcaceae bacterium]|nr:2-hydroxychromene-2-carboxylate isomerase [Myxococcaceae bacterium]
MARTLEFFFDIASPYSYLASTQVEQICERTGARLEWKPVLLGGIFKATGNVSPLTNPVKAAYLMKDVLDWCTHYRIPPMVLPEAFPIHSLKADRLLLVAQQQGRLPALLRLLYAAAFQHGLDVNEPRVLEDALKAAELDAATSMAKAETQEIKDALRANTDDAIARGAFGLPLFFVGEQMFVGNDRLLFVEAALRA